MSHVYCPECGFQNPEAANYCARCGAYLRRDEHGETTLSLGPGRAGRGGRRRLEVARPGARRARRRREAGETLRDGRRCGR